MIELPDSGWTLFGKVALNGDGEARQIPVALPAASLGRIDVALWWPAHPERDDPAQPPHAPSDVDVFVLDERCRMVARGVQPQGVYERAAGDLGSGPAGRRFTIRILARHLAEGPQVVYWAAALRP
jgi:hypothetical protein